MAGKRNIPAHVIAARGRKITLIDGSTPTLVYGFSSIMRLEEDFGSLHDAFAKLQGDSASLTSVAKILAAGLEHESTDHGLLSDLEVLRDLLDSKEIEAYSEAIGEAFELSFPSKDEDDGTGPTPGSADSSPGLSGTTPEPSSSDVAMQSSGA